MKYPRTFEKWYAQNGDCANLLGWWQRIEVKYHLFLAWKAGRRHEKSLRAAS